VNNQVNNEVNNEVNVMESDAPIDYIDNYDSNNKDIQDYESTACGYFCIAFIKFSYHMKDVKRALFKFDDLFCKNTKKNDYVLCNMLNGFLNMDLEIRF
jgi:hypothetical protein